MQHFVFLKFSYVQLHIQHIPDFVLKVGNSKNWLNQSQSALISHKMPFAGKHPCICLLCLSLFNQAEPSCLLSGYWPFFRQVADHMNIFQISSFVSCPKIHLDCMTVKGTPSFQWKAGKLTVMNSKLVFRIVPSTGTASPWSWKGMMPSTGKPKHGHNWCKACSNLLPGLGIQADWALGSLP